MVLRRAVHLVTLGGRRIVVFRLLCSRLGQRWEHVRVRESPRGKIIARGILGVGISWLVVGGRRRGSVARRGLRRPLPAPTWRRRMRTKLEFGVSPDLGSGVRHVLRLQIGEAQGGAQEEEYGGKGKLERRYGRRSKRAASEDLAIRLTLMFPLTRAVSVTRPLATLWLSRLEPLLGQEEAIKVGGRRRRAPDGRKKVGAEANFLSTLFLSNGSAPSSRSSFLYLTCINPILPT